MKNNIQILRSSAQANRIKRKVIKFKCVIKRTYTLITAKILGYVKTPSINKKFMESVPVAILVNDVFTNKTIVFNSFIPYNLPPSLKTLQNTIKYFVIVKVFDGKNELVCIKGKFKLYSNSYTYTFRNPYVLNQNCCRLGLESYENMILRKMRNV